MHCLPRGSSGEVCLRQLVLISLCTSLALVMSACGDDTKGSPQSLTDADAAAVTPSMDVSMDSSLPPHQADDAAVWDPSSGLPRECVEKPKPLVDPKFLQLCPNCEGKARCVPT